MFLNVPEIWGYPNFKENNTLLCQDTIKSPKSWICIRILGSQYLCP